MNVNEVTADLLAAIEPGMKEAGVSPFDYPVGRVSAPASIIGFPESINYHGAYQGGMVRLSIPLILVVGRVNEESTARLLGEFCSTVGDKSIPMIIENASYTALDVVTVTGADFDVVEIAGASYEAVLFTLDIAVSGR